jgi:hypothetical protein
MSEHALDYALKLLNQWKDEVALNKRTRQWLEKLPMAVCWDIMPRRERVSGSKTRQKVSLHLLPHGRPIR